MNPVQEAIALNMLIKLHKKNLLTTEQYNQAVILLDKRLAELRAK